MELFNYDLLLKEMHGCTNIMHYKMFAFFYYWYCLALLLLLLISRLLKYRHKATFLLLFGPTCVKMHGKIWCL